MRSWWLTISAAREIVWPVELPDDIWQEVRALYGYSGGYGGATPGRAYHTYAHVLEVVERWREVERDVGWTHPDETFLAALYHDAVYVPGRHDNETESARHARAAAERLQLDAALVEKLILLTARHGHLSPTDVDAETALFLDCDMAILGADAECFDEYERQIAQEYSVIPPELYAAGRKRFLESLLGAPRIYLSKYFHDRLDAAARANLSRVLGIG